MGDVGEDGTFATLTNYLTGGITTYDMDDTTVTWTATGAGLTFRYVVFHDDTVTVGPPIKPLIGYIDCGAQTITTGNTFTITPNASGVLTYTAASGD